MCMNSTVTLYLILCVIDTKINTLLYRKSSRLLIAVSVTNDTWLTYDCLPSSNDNISISLPAAESYWHIKGDPTVWAHVYINRECLRRWLISIYRKWPTLQRYHTCDGKTERVFICADNILYNCDTLLRIIQKSTYK